MGWIITLAAGAIALLLLLLSGFLHARRGIGRLSLLPWDYVMILSAIVLIASVAHAVTLWKNGWPLPWATASL